MLAESRGGLGRNPGKWKKPLLEHRGLPARGSSGPMLRNAFFHFPVLCPGNLEYSLVV